MSTISILDLLFITYLIWSFVKGKRKGLGKELEGFIVALLFLGTLLGVFVISILSGVIQTTLTALLSPGLLISLSSFILAVFVFFFFRKKISQFSESSFSPRTSLYGGAVIGLFRGVVTIVIVSIFITALPFGLFHDTRKSSQIYNQLELLLNFDPPTPASPTEPEELIIGY